MTAQNPAPPPPAHTPAQLPGVDENALQERLNAARQHCARRGALLTAQRSEVLELLLRRGGTAKAYDLQEDMQRSHRGRIAPTTVYRALDFLQDHKLVHKVDATNAFMACEHSECDHLSLLLICTDCGRVDELHDDHALASLLEKAVQRGYAAQAVEVKSLCTNCQRTRESAQPHTDGHRH